MPPGSGNRCQRAGSTGLSDKPSTSLAKSVSAFAKSRKEASSHPWASMTHSQPVMIVYACAEPQPGQNFALPGIALPHSMQNLEPAAAGAAGPAGAAA